ncbi:MAG: hypothetical protein ACTS73_05405 [Arsenophonus sp. NEOnobi-MAG3]
MNSFVMVPGNSDSHQSLRLSSKLCCDNMAEYQPYQQASSCRDAVICNGYLP